MCSTEWGIRETASGPPLWVAVSLRRSPSAWTTNGRDAVWSASIREGFLRSRRGIWAPSRSGQPYNERSGSRTEEDERDRSRRPWSGWPRPGWFPPSAGDTKRRPMLSFGITFMADPPVSRVVRMTKLAEDNGFDYAWIWDSHVLWQEVYPIFALQAANTSKIRLGPCVTNPATRDLTVTASALATLNEISGGRM